MAEAIVILGVTQILDFGTKFLSRAWNLYSTGRDGIRDISDLESITIDLQKILQSLRAPVNDNGELSGGQTDLRQLAEQCQLVATELLNLLPKISLPDKTSKRDALKAAFRLVWKEDEIRHLQVRLEGF